MAAPAFLSFSSALRCTPDVCSYTTMLTGYVNASDMEGAEKFFKRFNQDGLKPNVVTYGVFLKGYAKVNDADKMIRLYEDMRIRGIQLNETIFTTIMDAHGKDGDIGNAVIWYKEMESCGIVPDQKAKNILLSLAKNAEEQSEALFKPYPLLAIELRVNLYYMWKNSWHRSWHRAGDIDFVICVSSSPHGSVKLALETVKVQQGMLAETDLMALLEHRLAGT